MEGQRIHDLPLVPINNEDPVDGAKLIQQGGSGRGRPRNPPNPRNPQASLHQQVPPVALQNEGYASAIMPPRIRGKPFQSPM
ncbi:hypothetical protein KY290_017515 [Solanum tuberosum]|uniref:Uncharacterized protein n=1 Tax=Solanum tuberosum TaxID=4113 RepID=A0ABQ7VBM0_SOLTU|nr:hypothetical protein KY290_017515 [Solanum tuberosum]